MATSTRTWQLELEGDDVVLRRTLRSSLKQLAFAVAWNASLVGWYLLVLRTKNPQPLFVWLPLVHVVVGVGLLYATLARFGNRLRIEVGAAGLHSHQGPLPWRAQRVPLSQLTGFRTFRRDDGLVAVHALLADGRALPLRVDPLIAADADTVVERLRAQLARWRSDLPATPRSEASHVPDDLSWKEQRNSDGIACEVGPARSNRWQLWYALAQPVLFAIVWGTGLLDRFMGGSLPPMMLVPACGFMAILIAVMARRALNRGVLELRTATLRVRQQPIPWPRPLMEPTPNLTGFASAYAETKDEGRTVRTDFVEALTNDGRKLRLPLGTMSEAGARFIAARLNALLEELRTPKTYRG